MEGFTILSDALEYAATKARAADWMTFGELVGKDIVELGVVECRTKSFAEIQITRGGSLEILLAGKFQFLDFDHDWDADPSLRSRVDLAFAIFKEFLRHEYSMHPRSWGRRPYVILHGLRLRGNVQSAPLVDAGPLSRAGELPCSQPTP